MLDLSAAGPIVLALVFLLTTGVIALIGPRLTETAEHVASETGWGQAVVGAVAIGISTSLAGSIVSIYAAAEGRASLAISNSIGGIAAQTAFLAVADLTYRHSNLEHAAASLENLAQGTLLIVLLSLPVLAAAEPGWQVFAVHPVSIAMLAAYGLGLTVVRAIRIHPMWKALRTRETQREPQADVHHRATLRSRIRRLLMLVSVLGIAGYVLTEAAFAIISQTGMSESLVGGLFTSVATSMPELLTTLAAVRRGAVNLAVGNIIGGNSFDVLFLAMADLFFREGPIYPYVGSRELLLIGTAILMTATLMLGMLRREPRGPAGIGFESVFVLGFYVALAVFLFT